MPIKALFKAIQNVHLFHMASLICLTLKVKTRLENPKYKQVAFCKDDVGLMFSSQNWLTLMFKNEWECRLRGRVKGRGLTGCQSFLSNVLQLG